MCTWDNFLQFSNQLGFLIGPEWVGLGCRDSGVETCFFPLPAVAARRHFIFVVLGFWECAHILGTPWEGILWEMVLLKGSKARCGLYPSNNHPWEGLVICSVLSGSYILCMCWSAPGLLGRLS